MNYDEYGFPIFDDDYIDDINSTNIVKEKIEPKPLVPKKENINIKKDKNALF